MEKFTTEDLIEELRQYHQPLADRKDGGITVQEWADAQNVSEKLAARQLKKLMEDGVLVREWSKQKAHSLGWVYYKKTRPEGSRAGR